MSFTMPFPDVLAALHQLVAATSSEVHRLALQHGIDALHFQNAIESTLDRYSLDRANRISPSMAPVRPLEKWSLDEDVQLRLEFESGMTLDVIAEQHVRTPLEIAERLYSPLNLLTEQAVEEIRAARNRQRIKQQSSVAPNLETEDVSSPVEVVAVLSLNEDVVSETEEVLTNTVPSAPTMVVPEVHQAETPVASSLAPSTQPPVPTPAPVPTLVQEPITDTPVVKPPEAPAPVEPPVQLLDIGDTPVSSDNKAPTVANESLGLQKPEFTTEEAATVSQILIKYSSKNAPQKTIREYVHSERFLGKVRKEVQAWLVIELAKIA